MIGLIIILLIAPILIGIAVGILIARYIHKKVDLHEHMILGGLLIFLIFRAAINLSLGAFVIFPPLDIILFFALIFGIFYVIAIALLALKKYLWAFGIITITVILDIIGALIIAGFSGIVFAAIIGGFILIILAYEVYKLSKIKPIKLCNKCYKKIKEIVDPSKKIAIIGTGPWTHQRGTCKNCHKKKDIKLYKLLKHEKK